MSLGQRGWQFPLLLVLLGLLVILVLNGLQLGKEASITATPTKTPAADLVDATLSELAVVVNTVATTLLPQTLPPATPTPISSPAEIIESPTPVPTFTSSQTRLPTWTSTPVPSDTPTLAPTWTATPVPTFTPPPQDASIASVQDHYWLERPISPERTNWINRIYPYGSTLGDTLPTHHGVEFYNPLGVPVLAAGAGIVVTAGADSEMVFGPRANFYGNLVVIQHEQLYQGQHLYSLYGHLSEVLVSEGIVLAAGDPIGLVGGTGVANGGVHLHFEVRVGENRYEMTRNPELWLRPFPGWGTIAGQLLWPDGSYVYQASLLVRRVDDPSRFVNRSIYTYADDAVNPDDAWRENFTTPDLEPGPYEVVFRHVGLDILIQELVWVYPGQTSFVTMQLDQGQGAAP